MGKIFKNWEKLERFPNKKHCNNYKKIRKWEKIMRIKN